LIMKSAIGAQMQAFLGYEYFKYKNLFKVIYFCSFSLMVKSH